MLSILPSIFGIHVFKHYCLGCNEDEIITTVITTAHSHQHDCCDCNSEQPCKSCSEHNASHSHDEDSTCQHQFKKADFEGKTPVVSFQFVAANIELFWNTFFANDYLIPNNNTKQYCSVIQKIPDEPSPELNCVFLL